VQLSSRSDHYCKRYGQITGNQGIWPETRFFFVYFLVVIDVGEEDKEEMMGTKRFERARFTRRGQILVLEGLVGRQLYKTLFKNNNYFVYK
jgi:hypothetical protein